MGSVRSRALRVDMGSTWSGTAALLALLLLNILCRETVGSDYDVDYQDLAPAQEMMILGHDSEQQDYQKRSPFMQRLKFMEQKRNPFKQRRMFMDKKLNSNIMDEKRSPFMQRKFFMNDKRSPFMQRQEFMDLSGPEKREFSWMDRI